MKARAALAAILAIFTQVPPAQRARLLAAPIAREDEYELSPEASQRIAFSLRKFFRGIGRG